MPAAYDIALDVNGDLPIEQNNFTIAPSDQQHIKDCMLASPGWWAQFYQNGVGLNAFLKSRVEPLKVIAKVKQQLQNDGYTLINPEVKSIGGEMVVLPKAVRL